MMERSLSSPAEEEGKIKPGSLTGVSGVGGSGGGSANAAGESAENADYSEVAWTSMWVKLAEFKKEHGHCNCAEGALGAWVTAQRDLHKTGDGELSQDKVDRLNQIGFEWQLRNPRHLQWETRFDQLKAFVGKYGHAHVPIGWPESVQLANWVSKQRQEYANLMKGRTTRLDENRIRLLNSVGFAWQLQRGGRRRQLKAKNAAVANAKQDQQSDDSDASPASEGKKVKARQERGPEEPCILPGEVLIGQGAPMPVSVDTTSHVPASDGLEKSRTKTVVQGGLLGAVHDSPASRGLTPSPLLTQALALQRQPSVGSPVAARGPMHRLQQIASERSGAAVAPTSELFDYMLARKNLVQSLQLQQAAATQPASLQQVLGGRLGYPAATSAVAPVATHSHSHLLSTVAAAQRHQALLPVLASHNPSSLLPLAATSSSPTLLPLTGVASAPSPSLPTAGSAFPNRSSWRATNPSGTLAALQAATLAGTATATAARSDLQVSDSAMQQAFNMTANDVDRLRRSQQRQQSLGLPVSPVVNNLAASLRSSIPANVATTPVTAVASGEQPQQQQQSGRNLPTQFPSN